MSRRFPDGPSLHRKGHQLASANRARRRCRGADPAVGGGRQGLRVSGALRPDAISYRYLERNGDHAGHTAGLPRYPGEEPRRARYGPSRTLEASPRGLREGSWATRLDWMSASRARSGAAAGGSPKRHDRLAGRSRDRPAVTNCYRYPNRGDWSMPTTNAAVSLTIGDQRPMLTVPTPPYCRT